MKESQAKALSDELLNQIYALPQGEKIKECIQCGTCSASCPSSAAMEYSPREIIAALRAGMLDRVLNANTVWMCVSCYSCTVRCPAGIPFTDAMYELKRLEVDKGLSKGANGAAMATAFAETVDKFGRNVETTLLRRYFLRTNPLKALPQIPLATRLFFKGRLDNVYRILFPRRVRGLRGLRKMLAAIEENGTQ
ncbi:MAG: 4Fe-4S dicluster domain-containing protein [Planctomycetota bacterium]